MIWTRRIAGLVAATLLAGPAFAASKVATYTGTVHVGIDQTGVFGAPDTDLAGEPIVVRLQYDTHLGFRTTSASEDMIVGGAVYGTATPYRSVAVTIGGVTREIFSRGFRGTMDLMPGSSFDQFAGDQSTADGFRYNFVTADTASALVPASLDKSFAAAAGDTSLSGQFYTADAPGWASRSANFTSVDATLVVYNILPEPASWALMIVGFGLVGATARRRRALA